MHPRCLILVAMVGCYHPQIPDGAPCSDDSQCPVEQTCSPQGRCESSLDAGASDGACGFAPHCEGNDLVTCSGSSTCELGCDPAGARCTALVPSNGISPTLLTGATTDVTGPKLDFDTETGEIRAANILVRNFGEGVIGGIGFTIVDGMGVFTANSFVANANETWTASGDNSLVLFAATTIAVGGTIDVGADLGTGGPGGSNAGATNAACPGGKGTFAATAFGAGGGGGGGAGAGGNGGGAVNATAGAGGASCSQPSTIPLDGGNGGGAGGVAGTIVHGGRGGGGGGAIALVAMSSISIAGIVGAPGDGGASVAGGDGGGGGGSGGAILLEAPTIIVIGAATANGGGGGGPSASTGTRGHMADANPALGGLFNGVRGGAGGAGPTPPTNGGTVGDGVTSSRGGGGGGASGRIEIKSMVRTIDTAAVVSPMPTLSVAVVQ